MDRPYEWDFHLATWMILALAVTLVVVGHRRLLRTNRHPIRWRRHDIGFFASACACLLIALTWPVADLAAHWSLTALVVQRLVLMLAVAPMLILGLPFDVLEWVTRPALVDAALNRGRRPATAIVVVTVLTVAAMTPPAVDAQSSSSLVRAALMVVALAAGVVLWIPVLGRVPGLPRLRPMVRFGYLAAQAVVPAFLGFILILAPHPLYTAFAGSKAAIGLRPLNDQQIAGFASKLIMLLVLLTVGGVGLTGTPTTEAGDDSEVEDPLVWADVQRQFERADRQGPAKQPSAMAAAAPGDPPDPPGRDGPEP